MPLHRRIRLHVVPMNEKIADITHPDTEKHFLNLEPVLHPPGVAPPETRKIIGATVTATRISGTGEFRVYPNEGTIYSAAESLYRSPQVIIKDGTQRLQYNQTVANDDWDLYCLGYVVEA